MSARLLTSADKSTNSCSQARRALVARDEASGWDRSRRERASMRKELFVGLALAASTFLLVLIGGWLDLDVAAIALLGVTAGAVVGLVPDRSAAARIGGFAVGFVICWIGYFVRAALMPDTETGRAVTFGLVLLLALGATLVAVGRLPFWSVLLGVGTFAGAYETVYEVAPPLVLDTSISTASALLLTVAVGFLSVAWFGPEHEKTETVVVREDRDDTPQSPRTRKDDDTVALDSMMGSKR
jgi:hypothetical protein